MPDVTLSEDPDDYIDPAGQTNQIFALGGDDTLRGGDGDDTLNGGSGTDEARYDEDAQNGGAAAIVANLTTGIAFDGFGNRDTLVAIENLFGTAFNDRITGNATANVLSGDAGNDLLYGDGGNDTLNGGTGNDHLHGGLGADRLIGGDGLDYARYDDANYGNLVINLTAPNINTGAAAGDIYVGIECAVAGVGNDTVYGTFAANRLFGEGGTDAIFGRDGIDYVSGGAGDDALYGGNGADQLVGGDGFDLARYDDADYGGLVVSLADPGMNTGAAAGDTYDGIEGLAGGVGNDFVLGDAGANRLYGGGGVDLLFGNDGADLLDGGAANDALYGGLGADQHVGGDGLDYARYDDADYGNLVVSLNSPSINTGAAAGDTYSGIEAIVAGAGSDRVFGNAVDNRLFGMAGVDLLYGLDGSDYLDGGAENDALYGGLGADRHVGGDGLDYARYDDAFYGDLVIDLQSPGANTGAAAGDTYSSIEAVVGGLGSDAIYGDGGANRLFGGDGPDALFGRAGADFLSGDLGNDVLYGGAGADRLDGGDALDFVAYDDADYGDLVINLTNSSLNTGAAAGDVYVSIESVIGGTGNDTIVGTNASYNRLLGGAGNDTIDGLGGIDFLDGGFGGADSFRFSTALGPTNNDSILGFETGLDRILLSQTIFAGIGATLDVNEFGATADPDTLIIYNQDTGEIFYDAGGSEAGAAPVVFANVGGFTVVDLNDFVMV